MAGVLELFSELFLSNFSPHERAPCKLANMWQTKLENAPDHATEQALFLASPLLEFRCVQVRNMADDLAEREFETFGLVLVARETL